MHSPIIQVKTTDNLWLHGLLFETNKKNTIVINVHGTASSFFDEDFTQPLGEALSKLNAAYLSANNRGNAVLQAYPAHGAALERFEDCVLDIDAWIDWALKHNYKRIILQGHSLGTEKVVYYMNKGTYRRKVSGVILLAFADSYGYQQQQYGSKNIMAFLDEATRMRKSGKGNEFLRLDWLCYGKVMPKSANSYLNFMSQNSELSKALPFHKKTLKAFNNIKIPVLGLIGDEHEYTVIPIVEAIALLKKNPHAQCYQIKNCNHDFEGCEKELIRRITSFVRML